MSTGLLSWVSTNWPLLCSGPAASHPRTAGYFTPRLVLFQGVCPFPGPPTPLFRTEKETAMLSEETVRELRRAWLPNITDEGLDHLIELLEKGSPLLIHG